MILSLTNKLAYDDGPEIGKITNNYKDTIKSLNDEYLKRVPKAENCVIATRLANEYMEKMANLTVDYQKAYLRIYKDYYRDWQFWGTFYAIDEHTKKATFCRNAAGLLGVLSVLAQTHFLNPCVSQEEIKKDSQVIIVPRPDCPIDIDWSCSIGSFHLDCEKISFSNKEPLLLNIDHSFTTHRTTIMIGLGVDLSFKKSVGNIEGEGHAGGTMKYFITFDGTRPSDQGLAIRN